jgi:hypothetical protein
MTVSPRAVVTVRVRMMSSVSNRWYREGVELGQDSLRGIANWRSIKLPD